MNKVIPLLFVFILCCSVVSATTNYTSYGNEDKLYELGSGVFNANLDNADTNVNTRTVTTGRQAPLVVDMDNDGISEIIVLDDDSIRLFNNKELDIVDTYAFTSSFVDASNMIAFDIDNDGRTEVIIAHGDASSERIHIIDYNGTAMVNTSLDWTTANRDTNGDMSIACRDTNDCLLIFAESEDVVGQDDMRMLYFNSSAVGSEVLIDQVSFANGFFCHSFIRGITVADNDADGTDEYIFTAIEHDNAQLDMNWFMWDIEVSGDTPSATTIIDARDTGVSFPQTDDTCSSFNQDITLPLVFDIDGSPSNGVEYVIAHASSDTEYLMESFENDGSFLDDYPETDDSDGSIISNVVRANSFEDTGQVDFCVMGFRNTDSSIVLTCASEQTGETPETNEFTITAPFNITDAQTQYNTILHSVQHSTATIDGTDVSEFSSSYGIISIEDASILGNGDLTIEFAVAQTDGAVVPNDGEQFGIDDLLILTDTNIYYVDDGQSNEEASITSLTFNPCPVDTVIKVNETMTMSVTVTDNNPSQIGQDQVSTTVTFYDGDSNEFSVSSPNVTSGSSIPIITTLNKTITLGTITVEAFDSFDGLVDDSQTQLFTVANNGILAGDQSCTTTFVTEEAELTAEEQAEADFIEDNSITGAVDETISLIFGQTASGLSRSIVWLILMLIVAWGIWNMGSPGSHTFGMIIMMEILMLILGVKLQLISTGILVSVVVLGLISVVLVMRNILFGNSSNQ